MAPQQHASSARHSDTITDRLRSLATSSSRADQVAIVDRSRPTLPPATITFAELDERVRASASFLQHAGLRGERVMIMLPQGLDYAIAVLACFYAGAIAVPAYPVGGKRVQRFSAIASDCRPALAITTLSRVASVAASMPEECRTIAFEEAIGDSARWTPGLGIDVAYLQYTSGSTSDPKGVVITNECLTAELDGTLAVLGITEHDVFVSWLPMFHDYGLVCGLLAPLWAGAQVTLLSPQEFARDPLVSLQVASDCRATVLWSLDFAMTLICDRLKPDSLTTIDLSSVRSVPSGGEPVKPQTLRRFVSALAPAGITLESVSPGYGLAETTAILTSKLSGEPCRITSFNAEALHYGSLEPGGSGQAVKEVVSNGSALPGCAIVVVDPDSGAELPDGIEGELWASGPIVGRGYWGNEDSHKVFGATTADGRGPFLRTGDMGAWFEGELYITGRLKDLMIFNGRNVQPHDVEHTVWSAHPALARAAAFSVGEKAELVVVVELDRNSRHDIDYASVVNDISRAVGQDHELAPIAVLLLQPASLPITSSGKVRRAECKAQYEAGSLLVAHSWQRGSFQLEPDHSSNSLGRTPDRAVVERWLTARISRLTGLPEPSVDRDAPFFSLGLGSIELAELSGDLSAFLDQSVSETAWFDYPSISEFARSLTPSGETVGHAQPQPQPSESELDAPSESEARAASIAIVGMACQFPGASDIEEFWELIRRGGTAITNVPANRESGFRGSTSSLSGSAISWGGFLEDIEHFDSTFFGVSKNEADSMDPQQRLLLTNTWRAIEDAGLSPDLLRGSRTGVFVGISTTDYRVLQSRGGLGTDAYSGTGNSSSIAANRISYHFDFRGPSMAIDTACSSSLVALHEAVRHLRSGECDVAVVAGVNAILDPSISLIFDKAGMLSPYGLCKTFDAGADGYVRGEGCGVLILRLLRDAVRDGDTIHAVVRGSAINQDGRSSSLTAPNGLAQQEVIRSALLDADTTADRVTLVEAHGTGTRLGDPIEMSALRAVYGGPSSVGPLDVASVKTNIGHLESAAGVAGLIKSVLCLREEATVAHLNLESINPLINLEGSRIRIPTNASSWNPRGTRMAGVSSFGFGGTNAHCIVEQAPVPGSGSELEPGLGILPMSARTAGSLTELEQSFATTLFGTTAWPATARAAGVRRAHHRHRTAVIARDADSAASLLAQGKSGVSIVRGTSQSRGKSTALVFTGQGAQYRAMAAPLYRRFTLFRDVIDEVDALVQGELGFSVLPTIGGPGEPALDLTQTLVAQPAIFAVGFALGELWKSIGVAPDFAIGHSLGEITALASAEVINLRDAVRIVCVRAQVMQDYAGEGAMFALHGPPHLLDAVRTELANSAHLAIAAENSPEHLVVSGPTKVLEAAMDRWGPTGLVASRLLGSRAFHSPMMGVAARRLADAVADVSYRVGKFPVLSNITADVINAEELSAEHWFEHALHPVQFAASVETLRARGCETFIECGPHPVLAPLGLLTAPGTLWIQSLNRNDEDEAGFLRNVGQLYVSGSEIDWLGFERARSGEAGTIVPAVPLPKHPLHPRRHWVGSLAGGRSEADIHPLLGRRIELALSDLEWFTSSVTARDAEISGHTVLGSTVLPATASIAWVASLSILGAPAGRPVAGTEIRGLDLLHLVAIDDENGVELQTCVGRSADGQEVTCFSRRTPGGEWIESARARSVAIVDRDESSTDIGTLAAGLDARDIDEHYASLRQRGLEYGDNYRLLTGLWARNDTAVGLVDAPGGATEGYPVSPRIMDAALHAIGALLPPGSGLWLPSTIERVTISAATPSSVWCRVRLSSTSESAMTFHIEIFDDAGSQIIAMEGLALQRSLRAALTPRLEADPAAVELARYVVEWQPIEADVPSTSSIASTARWVVMCQHPARLDRWVQELGNAGTVFAALWGEGTRTAGSAWRPWLDATNAEQVRAFIDSAAQGGALAGIVVIPDCEEQASVDLGMAEVVEGLTWEGLSLLRHGARVASEARLIVCTEGASSLPDISTAPSILNGVWTGLVRAAIAEGIDCVQVDLNPGEHNDSRALEIARRAIAEVAPGHLAERSGVWFRAELSTTNTSAAGRRMCPVRPASTYLISGGTGGLGLATAQWLASHGAQNIVVLGREAGDRDIPEIAGLRHAGVEVLLATVDLSSAVEVEDLLATIDATMPPLRGIIHAAGATSDAVLDRLTREDIRSTVYPKVSGAWNLHRASQARDLDFFILYSSMASLTGSAGQANYVAANAFLDALADSRRFAGLPAVSIQWSPWADTGMANTPMLKEAFARQGIAPIPRADNLALLDSQFEHSSAAIGFAHIDWDRFARSRMLADTFLPSIAAAESEPITSRQTSIAELTELAIADPRTARDRLLDTLVTLLAPLLGLRASEASDLRGQLSTMALSQLGLDSLSAVRLRASINSDLGVDVAPDLLFGEGTGGDVVSSIAEQLILRSVMSEPSDSGNLEVFTL